MALDLDDLTDSLLKKQMFTLLMKRDLEGMRSLLQQAPSLARSVFIHAVERDFGAAVELLLTHGGDLASDVHLLDTGVEAALRQCSRLALSVLLNYVDVNKTVGMKGTFLEIACSMRERDTLHMVRILLDRGADPNKRGNAPQREQTCMHNALSHDTTLLSLLISRGANPNSQPPVLHLAIQRGYWDAFELLLSASARVDLVHRYSNCTALQVAVRAPNATPYVRRLLSLGAQAGFNNSAALVDAMAVQRVPEIIELLLDHGADPRVLDVRQFAVLCNNEAFRRHCVKSKLL